MNLGDKNNLSLASSQAEVDNLNSKFYSRFNYPWYPQEFPYFEDKDLWRKMLCQDVGDWTLTRMPEDMKIWVAGCGTNQAIFTALKYPNAQVIGTDISPKSIEVCKGIARQLKIKNLVIEETSLNNIRFLNEFDYIICTGVIHHNADPSITLEALSKALKQNGIMELMVYNYYHRILSNAYQKAVRKISHSERKMDLEQEYHITRQLIQKFPIENLMKDFLASLWDKEESLIADTLIQPVEHSFTIGSLNELVDGCNLQLLYHCISQFDEAQGRLSWNLDLDNDSYNSLPDIERWHVGNLLMLESSPMLWFYLQRKDSEYIRRSEQEMCRDFLDGIFSKNETVKYCYTLSSPAQYESRSKQSPFPMPTSPVNKNALKVFHAINSEISIEDILKNLKLDRSFNAVNELRINLSTSTFPYIVSCNNL